MNLFGPNTPIVLLGTTILGVAGGVVGTFMLLRKRSLMGDVISHASLPGIVLAFIVMELWQADSGKSLPALLLGALITGVLGIFAVVAIRRSGRIKEDAAMAIVLSVMFGFGAALLSMVQKMNRGSAAGLPHFIYGSTALIIESDVWLIAAACLVVLLACGLLLKEFTLLSFDPEFAGAQGWPVFWLDAVLMGLVVGVTIVGLQSVGLLLVVAILVVPAAAARFWTDHLLTMAITAGVLGGLSGATGTLVSSAARNLPAGAIIVLVAAGFFLFSLLLGRQRGLLRRLLADAKLRRRVARQHLLRGIYEALEAELPSDAPASRRPSQEDFTLSQLQSTRTWSPRSLTSLLGTFQREGLVERLPDKHWRLTAAGSDAAERVVRNHRLWELYLIHFADVAANHVDRDADMIEHVLRPEIIRELDLLLSQQYPEGVVPPSPHAIESKK